MCTLQVYENSVEVFSKCDIFLHLSRVLVARELEELEEGEEGMSNNGNKVFDANHKMKVSSGQNDDQELILHPRFQLL